MAEGGAGSRDARHDGADGDVEDEGDVFVLEVFDVAEEEEFAEFNRAMDYPERLSARELSTSLPPRAVPSFEATRRYDRIAHRSPLRRLVRKLTGTAKLTPDEVAEATGVPQRPVK